VSSIMIFPKIERHYISNHWGFRSYEETCYLNYAIKSLPKLNNEGNIQFSVNVFNQLTYETEINEYTFGNAIANLGGFYVALNSMYVLLFGMPKLSPWYELFNRTLNDALPNSSSLIFVHSQGYYSKICAKMQNLQTQESFWHKEYQTGATMQHWKIAFKFNLVAIMKKSEYGFDISAESRSKHIRNLY
ncbi:12007_t:CDS:2, partial [Entrophospora sp. SA101]